MNNAAGHVTAAAAAAATATTIHSKSASSVLFDRQLSSMQL